jgi:ribosomal protein L16/L10AE
MKLKKKKLNKDKICFKQRHWDKKKSKKLNFGTHGIYFTKALRLELIYLVMLRKLLKRLKRIPKRNVIYHKKMWFWLRKNFPISKKSKNARMGKGKGKFLRWTARIPLNYVILEFWGWTPYVLEHICRRLNKKNNINLWYFTNLAVRPHVVMSNHKYSHTLISRYSMKY